MLSPLEGQSRGHVVTNALHWKGTPEGPLAQYPDWKGIVEDFLIWLIYHRGIQQPIAFYLNMLVPEGGGVSSTSGWHTHMNVPSDAYRFLPVGITLQPDRDVDMIVIDSLIFWFVCFTNYLQGTATESLYSTHSKLDSR